MRRKVSRTQADIALHDAAMSGNLEGVKAALANGANVNSQEEEHYTTPLLWACSYGHLNVASYLVDAGADINYADENLGRPLHNAIANGFPEVVRLLLEHGVDMNALDACGLTPMEAAIVYGEPERAARQDIIAALLDAGYNINTRNPDLNNRTPLMVAVEAAAENGKTGTVSYLLTRGADRGIRDGDGLTAADYADPDLGDYAEVALRALNGHE